MANRRLSVRMRRLQHLPLQSRPLQFRLQVSISPRVKSSRERRLRGRCLTEQHGGVWPVKKRRLRLVKLVVSVILHNSFVYLL